MVIGQTSRANISIFSHPFCDELNVCKGDVAQRLSYDIVIYDIVIYDIVICNIVIYVSTL